MSAALALSDDSVVVYQGWLQGVQEGQKIKINGKIYLAKEVASRKTIYQLSGVSRAYYAKTVVEKIVKPILEKIKCKVSSLLSRKEPEPSEEKQNQDLRQFAKRVEQHAQLNKRLHRQVRVLQVAGLRVLQKLELRRPNS